MSEEKKYSVSHYEQVIKKLLSETELLKKEFGRSANKLDEAGIGYFVSNLESILNQIIFNLDYRSKKQTKEIELVNSLYKISETASLFPKLEDLYSKLFQVLNEFISTKNFYIVFYNESKNGIEFPFEFSSDDSGDKMFSNITFGKTLAENFRNSDEQVTVNINLGNRKGNNDNKNEMIVEWLGTPLLSNEKIIGAIVTQKHVKDGKFTDEDKKLLAFAARQFILAIEKKESEFTLKRSEQQFRTLFEKNPLMIFTVDVSCNITKVNKQACGELGYSPEELIGQSVLNIFHKDERQSIEEHIKNCIANKNEKLSWQGRKVKKDGGIVWVKEIASAMVDSTGKTKVLIVCENINELVETETRLGNLSHYTELLLSSAGEGILGLDINGKITFANPAAASMVEWEVENLIGKSFRETILHLDPERTPYEEERNTFLDTIRNKKVNFINDESFWKSNGTSFPAAYRCSPIIDDKQVEGVVITFQDISEQKKSESEIQKYIEEIEHNQSLIEKNAENLSKLNEKLLESEEKLKETNKSKDRFFSIISHDLRSPFTSLLGFSEYMANYSNEFSGDELKEYATHMYHATKNILTLLENLLQWSRVQTGRIEFIPEELDVKSLVAETVNLYGANAQIKGISLLTEVDEGLIAYADKNMIDTVMRNLLSNAIKFSNPNDNIFIRARIKNDKIIVEITDTGIGMDEDSLNKLFKIDELVSTDGTSKERGSGLGLILCREFIEKNNGNISVESTPGKGTTFQFTLPTPSSHQNTSKLNSLTETDI